MATTEYDVEAIHARAVALEEAGDFAGAIGLYGLCLNLSFRHAPSRARLIPIAKGYRREAAEAEREGDVARALDRIVRAVELAPHVPEWLEALDRLSSRVHPRDMTRECYAYYDPKRARTIHEDAIRRVIDYVTLGGVVGDVMEFGVLGGWSARIFAETMRDVFNMNHLHLFDSFEGLPGDMSSVDLESYEIGGRNAWPQRMCFDADFVAALGEPIDRHIERRIATIIRPERVHVRRGFFRDTLRQPLNARAAVIHVDCDLYDSTIEVLWSLHHQDVLQDGCVVMFDDWNLNKASPRFGERRAFREFLDGQERFSASPFFTYGFNGAVFFLHEAGA